jgi:hypothetical protein
MLPNSDAVTAKLYCTGKSELRLPAKASFLQRLYVVMLTVVAAIYAVDIHQFQIFFTLLISFQVFSSASS